MNLSQRQPFLPLRYSPLPRSLSPIAPVVFRSITQRFGKHTALSDVSLELPAGRIVGLHPANRAR